MAFDPRGIDDLAEVGKDDDPKPFTWNGWFSYPTGPDLMCPQDPDFDAGDWPYKLSDPSCPHVDMYNPLDSNLMYPVELITTLMVVLVAAFCLIRFCCAAPQSNITAADRKSATVLKDESPPDEKKDVEAPRLSRSASSFTLHYGEPLEAMTFQSNCLGTLALYSLGAFYCLPMYIVALVMLDHYWACQLTGPNNMCFFGTYPIFGSYAHNSVFMAFAWVACLFVYGHMIMFRSRLPNFFRIPSSPAKATHVAVLLPPQAQERVVDKPSFLVKKMREFKKGANKTGATTVQEWETCPVYKDKGGTKYIEFRSARYVLRGDEFVKGSPKLTGTTLANLGQKKHGLSRGRREVLDTYVGKNAIPFKVAPIGTALMNEFFQPFYLMQLQMLLVWLWFSYVFVGSILTIVVLVAGFSNVAIMRSAQERTDPSSLSTRPRGRTQTEPPPGTGAHRRRGGLPHPLRGADGGHVGRARLDAAAARGRCLDPRRRLDAPRRPASAELRRRVRRVGADRRARKGGQAARERRLTSDAPVSRRVDAGAQVGPPHLVGRAACCVRRPATRKTHPLRGHQHPAGDGRYRGAC